MAKILNTTTFNGNVSKMVETPDQLIINGSCCDKSSMSPTPFDFYPLYVSSNNEMILSQVAYVNSYWYRNRTSNGFMLDSADPTSFYVATQGVLGGSCMMHKATRMTTGLVDNVQFGNWEIGGTYRAFMDLISQDYQNIYYTINRSVGGAYSYIGYYNKTTWTTGYINLSSGTIKLLKDIGTYLYISTTSVNANAINIGKYNKVNNTLTWILSEAVIASGYYSDTYPSDMDSNGIFYYARDGISYGKTDHFIAYRKYILNTVLDTVAISTVNVDMSLLPNKNIYWNTPSNMSISHSMFRYTDTNTGKAYMNHLIYNRGISPMALQGIDSALYTYEMIDVDNWKLVSYTQFNPIVYNAFLPCINNSILGLAYVNGAHFYVWDTASTSYKKTYGMDVPIDAIGNDTNNNIYVQCADSSIEMISNIMPVTIFADFDSDTYSVINADNVGNVIVYVKNYIGAYLSSSVTLQLYGNVKFTDTGLKTKVITTLNTGSTSIPVDVYDQGLLRVGASIAS